MRDRHQQARQHALAGSHAQHGQLLGQIGNRAVAVHTSEDDDRGSPWTRRSGMPV